MSEEWRRLAASSTEFEPFCGLYEVSSQGEVRRIETGRILKPWVGLKKADPYFRVRLCANGRRVVPWVHHLVAEAFLGPRPEGFCIDHLDGDKHHNAAANLEYVTPGENTRRHYGNGNGAGHGAEDVL
jgi:hypothetical protein